MNFDYAIHSDFLIHWTGKDIDQLNDSKWYESDKSKTNGKVSELYIKRLHDILKYGLWVTLEEKSAETLHFGNISVPIPDNPQTCFTELKLSESRKHARQYGRLGIGVKRPFVFSRFGRPLIYYGFHQMITKDKFLRTCATKLEKEDKKLLNFFKPMNRPPVLNYDCYSESEWRIIYFDELLSKGLVVDPRDTNNTEAHEYFCSLTKEEQDKLKYLIPLDGWFAMIIYPSLDVKNKAQQGNSTDIKQQIARIKSINDHGNKVEGRNWPIEINLDACRNF